MVDALLDILLNYKELCPFHYWAVMQKNTFLSANVFNVVHDPIRVTIYDRDGDKVCVIRHTFRQLNNIFFEGRAHQIVTGPRYSLTAALVYIHDNLPEIGRAIVHVEDV